MRAGLSSALNVAVWNIWDNDNLPTNDLPGQASGRNPGRSDQKCAPDVRHAVDTSTWPRRSANPRDQRYAGGRRDTRGSVGLPRQPWDRRTAISVRSSLSRHPIVPRYRAALHDCLISPKRGWWSETGLATVRPPRVFTRGGLAARCRC
jgi:hypothetical protein